MSCKTKVVVLNSYPNGEPTTNNFKFTEREFPKDLKLGQVLVKTSYLSVDPYMREKMSEEESGWSSAFKINEPLYGDGAGEVVQSFSTKFEKGDRVSSSVMEWAEFVVMGEDKLEIIPPNISPEVALGVGGMTGLTSYFGLMQIGQPQQGQTLVISGAAGAVGSRVGQLGKISGCKVIGIAGSDEKVAWLKEIGFDEGINYKKVSDLNEAIKKACPNGVDIFFDNVGGSTLDAVFPLLNAFGRVIHCGAISLYNLNKNDMPKGIRMEVDLVFKRLKMQGFLVYDFAYQWPEARKQLLKWYEEKKLNNNVTIEQGLERTPNAFLSLFKGGNVGKMLVKIC